MKGKSLTLCFALLLVAMTAKAWTETPPTNDTTTCEWKQWYYKAPDFFCECTYNSRPFSFPLDTVISDTVWYTATINDVLQGISAYWFADCPVTIEVYILCVSQEPTVKITVGKNRMKEMDVTEIGRRLEEAGSNSFIQSLTPHIRVYPNGGTGRVYVYPYNQGPHSTCGDPLPLRPGMTYVCDQAENVYRMDPTDIPASGNAFILWKQDKNKPADIWLTLDSCNGKEAGRTVLTDSLHVYQPDADMLKAARAAKRELWMHVKHADGIVGRAIWYSNPKYTEEAPAINNSTCLGKKLTINQRDYTSDTTFNDTLRYATDTLQVQPVNLTFTQPNLEYDTVRVAPSELYRGYRHSSGVVLDAYGDTIVDIVKANSCTRRIQITILEPSGIEELSEGTRAYKTIQNGQLFIIIDDRKYNVLGQSNE